MLINSLCCHRTSVIYQAIVQVCPSYSDKWSSSICAAYDTIR